MALTLRYVVQVTYIVMTAQFYVLIYDKALRYIYQQPSGNKS